MGLSTLPAPFKVREMLMDGGLCPIRNTPGEKIFSFVGLYVFDE